MPCADAGANSRVAAMADEGWRMSDSRDAASTKNQELQKPLP